MVAITISASAALRSGYRRRTPERGVLYEVLSEHLETFLARTREDGAREGLPRFVERELRAYLECGILSHGFARVRCESCGKDALVAFSCKGRGFCPSCNGRRMAGSAAHLVDRVLPHVPLRQWVLSLPWPIRLHLAYDPELCGVVRRIFMRTVLGWMERRLERLGFAGARGGAVNVVQRFGSAVNLNLHFHALVLDGAYASPSPLGQPVFHELFPPRDEDIAELVRILHDRVVRFLCRRGRLPSANGDDSQPDEFEPDEPLLAQLCSASVQGRIALGPKAGARIPRVGSRRGMTSGDVTGELCASYRGFSLHARVYVPPDDRERLERLCRYLTRGPLASERLSLTDDGRVLYQLRHPWRDGSTHVVFDPLTFIERLAALVPRPRIHLITYHGVLAPAASWRDLVVPRAPGAPGFAVSTPATCRSAPCEDDEHPPCGSRPTRGNRSRWSELMRRVFAIDVLECPHCGGRRRMIAMITDPAVIHRILAHLELPLAPPCVQPARPPPQIELPF